MQKMIAIVFVGLLSAAAWAAPIHPAHAPHAMVASVHELASQAGIEMMRVGGNAVDAAVATGFALAVVHPRAGNVGGGGFILLRLADGKVHFIDFRETAPAAASANMYRDSHGDVIPGASTLGYRSAGVPGSVAGLAYAEKQYGKLTLARTMEPAIRLAREGFPVSWEDTVDLRDRDLSRFPESRRIFQRDGKYFQQGELLLQPELARTLERIAANPDEFYHGAMAREIADAVQKGGGLITADDLAHYQVKEREPVRGTYRGYEVISSPPPSAGGVVLLEILNILEGYNLGPLGNRSADSMHLTVEAFRRAFFDKSEFMGDPDFARLPVAQLIDKKYAAAWRESIDPQHASSSKDLRRPSNFSGLEQVARETRSEVQAEHLNTTHFSVVDPLGNAVAVTTTLNNDFGSKVTLEGLGFLLNDEMDDFTSKPGVPNLYGLVQGPANAVGPDKRPVSSMTPTMLLKDGKLFLVMGSPGGSRIISTIANIVMSVIDYGMDIQQAVNAPRFHHQWLPDEIRVEQNFPIDTVRLLRQKGHKVEFGVGEGDDWEPVWSDGECIAIDPKTSERLGASDIRHNGRAVGF